MNFNITIAFDDYSRDAQGIPVPVEVFNEHLERVADDVADLGHDHTVAVAEPGLYQVRAELPSGENVATTVRVQPDGSVPVARLVSFDGLPSKPLTQNVQIGTVRNFGLVNVAATREDSAITITGLFRVDPQSIKHTETAWQLVDAPLDLLENALVEQPIAVDDSQLIKRIYLKQGSGKTAYPVYVRYSVRRTPKASESLGFIIVPTGMTNDLTEILFMHADFNEDADPNTTVTTLVRGGQPAAETLLAYLNQGSLRSAKRIAEQVIEQAMELLQGKQRDPFSACIAGYFLLQAGQLGNLDWMKNLAEWFPSIPDGAVIYGSALLRAGDRVLARSYLLETVKHGLPIYTVGLRLLFDNLRVLAQENDDDEELGKAIQRIRSVAAYTDWHAQYTTINFPNGVDSIPFLLPK
jgi:hypothetical protein